MRECTALITDGIQLAMHTAALLVSSGLPPMRWLQFLTLSPWVGSSILFLWLLIEGLEYCFLVSNRRRAWKVADHVVVQLRQLLAQQNSSACHQQLPLVEALMEEEATLWWRNACYERLFPAAKLSLIHI